MNDDVINHIINSLINKISEMYKPKPVYTRNEVLSLLDIDAKTLKRYQDEGLIGYSQPIAGGKVFFTAKDIDEFMANSHADAFYYNNGL